MEADSQRRRDRYAVREVYERRQSHRQPYRNGYYERDFVNRLGTLRLRVARTRGKSFLPRALEPFQRRAADVAMLNPGGIFARYQHAAGGTGGVPR